MKHKLGLLSIFVALALSLTLLSHASGSSGKAKTLTARQDDSDEVSACTDNALQGSYGITISGTRPAPPPPSGTPNYIPGTIEQLIGVGTRTFDGNGNFTQITNEKGSLSGILFPNRPLSGAYSINSDCSGTLTLHIPGLPFSILYDIVVVNHGRAFDSFVASPQAVMVTTSGRRVE